MNPFDLVGILNAVLASLDQAQRTAAASYDYSKVQVELDKLGTAVHAAIAADEQEAAVYWSAASKLMPLNPLLSVAKALFESQARKARTNALIELVTVRATCAALIGVHAGVPGQLLNDELVWSDNRAAVKKKMSRCEGLKQVDGWSGDSKIAYDRTVDLQVKALDELQGIMASTAQSCRAGALLNRAVFFVVAKAIRNAVGSISSAPGGLGSVFFLRTNTSVNALNGLKNEISAAKGGEVAAGSANVLSGELRNTVAMPNLLRVGSWPTGQDDGRTRPARTDQGVTSDGKDADLAVPDRG